MIIMKKKEALVKMHFILLGITPRVGYSEGLGCGLRVYISEFPGAAHVAHLGPYFENYYYKLFFCGWFFDS